MAACAVNESSVSSERESKREGTHMRGREVLSLQVEICDHGNNYVQSSFLHAPHMGSFNPLNSTVRSSHPQAQLCEDLDHTA